MGCQCRVCVYSDKAEAKYGEVFAEYYLEVGFWLEGCATEEELDCHLTDEGIERCYESFCRIPKIGENK